MECEAVGCQSFSIFPLLPAAPPKGVGYMRREL
jgi:hypothetical protein